MTNPFRSIDQSIQEVNTTINDIRLGLGLSEPEAEMREVNTHYEGCDHWVKEVIDINSSELGVGTGLCPACSKEARGIEL